MRASSSNGTTLKCVSVSNSLPVERACARKRPAVVVSAGAAGSSLAGGLAILGRSGAIAVIVAAGSLLAGLDIDVAAVAKVAVVIAGGTPLPTAVDSRRGATECSLPANRLATGEV